MVRQATSEELLALVQEQRDEIAALKRRLDELEGTRPSSLGLSRWKQRAPKGAMSRAGLLKAGAMGLMGLAGAELAGSVSAPAAEAFSDTNFIASGGTTIAFYQPGDTSAGFGYAEGAYLYGQSYGVHAEARDASGNLNAGTGVFAGSGSGYGLVGSSGSSGIGVYGTTIGYSVSVPTSAHDTGVLGESSSGTGVWGGSSGGVGLLGQTGSAALPPSGTAVGVYGTGAAPSGSVVPLGRTGVQGVSDSGTGVQGTSTSGAGVVGSSTSNNGVYGSSGSGQAGVVGVGDSTNYGVYGSCGAGIGVVGQAGGAVLPPSTTNVGVYGTGAAASGSTPIGKIGVQGVSDTNIGVLGTSSGSQAGVQGTNTSTGQGVRGNNTSTGIGVYGTNSSSGQGVYGYNTGTGQGVRGTNTSTGIGVYGINSSTGTGVYGSNGSSGIGVRGVSTSGYGGTFQGGQAPIRLIPSSTTGAPTSGTHNKGELLVDASGILWICISGGTPGTWHAVGAQTATTP
jgi:hypothetical protein